MCGLGTLAGDQVMGPLMSLLSGWNNSPATDRRWTNRPRAAEKKPSSKRQQPRLESLEGRALLTINVNTFQDFPNVVWDLYTGTKLVSLRAAINMANQEKSPDTIMVPAGNYQLTQGKVLEITSPAKVTIQGDAQNNTVVDALNKCGVFQVDKGSEVDFESLWIQGGNTKGGNVSKGGGIENDGTVEINNSYLYKNTADFGGGLLNNGTATLTTTGIAGNSATWSGGGIDNESMLTTTNCLFWGNKAGGNGGGLWNNWSATITGGTFLQNTSNGLGGGLAGGLSTTTFISNVNFASNHAAQGGGVANEGSMAILGGTFSGNAATDGGGAFNLWSMTVSGATFTGNTATDDGGGIDNSFGQVLTVVNSTLSNNSAGVAGGGLYSRGHKPSIDTKTLQQSTGNKPSDFDIA
jgi:hypothetical protein